MLQSVMFYDFLSFSLSDYSGGLLEVSTQGLVFCFFLLRLIYFIYHNEKKKSTLPIFCVYLHTSSGQLWRSVKYIEDITRWREDMNFIFEWQNNILRTSAASE